MTVVELFKALCHRRIYKTASNVYHEYKALQYRIKGLVFGKKYSLFCPCCGVKYRDFIAGDYISFVGKVDTSRYEHIDQNVICPVCFSLPRHRILASWFNEHKQILRSSAILCFAPEKSMTIWMDRNKVKYTTADLYQPADLRLDIQDTGLPADSYDLIICNHVLELNIPPPGSHLVR